MDTAGPILLALYVDAEEVRQSLPAAYPTDPAGQLRAQLVK